MAYETRSWPEIRERLQERYEGVPFWEADEALAAVNEGLRMFNLLAGYWHRTETLTTVAGQYEYALPASLLFRTRLEILGQALSPSSHEDLTNGRYQWRTETTASGGDVPTKPTLWAPVSLQLIVLWPASMTTGLELTVSGIAATPVLADGNNTLDLGDELLSVLLGYALHVLAFKKGNPAFSATIPYFTAFLEAAATENARLKATKFYRRWMGHHRRDQKDLTGPLMKRSA
jgi:hypothetical protein